MMQEGGHIEGRDDRKEDIVDRERTEGRALSLPRRGDAEGRDIIEWRDDAEGGHYYQGRDDAEGRAIIEGRDDAGNRTL